MSPRLKAVGGHAPGACVLYVPAGETIHIGPDIEVNIARSVDGRVALSICAPRELAIDRESTIRARSAAGVLP